jgi:hypothetical protein
MERSGGVRSSGTCPLGRAKWAHFKSDSTAIRRSLMGSISCPRYSKRPGNGARPFSVSRSRGETFAQFADCGATQLEQVAFDSGLRMLGSATR